MPRKKSSGRNANGVGSYREKTIIKNGKEYTYWEGRCTVGYDPGTGKQIQRTITGKTKAEVVRQVKQISVDVDNNMYLEPNKMTLSEWLDIWMAEYMGDKKYSTVKTYKANVETHIKPALGATKLSKLVPHMVQKFYNDLLDHGCSVPVRNETGKIVKKDGKAVTTPAPMSPKTLRNVHGTLTKALTIAVNNGYISKNPAANAVLPHVEKKEIHPLSDEQVKKFLHEASLDEYGTALKVILFTGLRESEALGLTWDCVDFKSGTIKVCKQLVKRKASDGGATLDSPKNRKTRVVKPAPFVMELLLKQYSHQSRQRLLSGEKWQGWQTPKERDTWFVFTTPDGKYVSQTSIRYHFKKVVAAIEIPESRVHDLRHTFAVVSLQNGDPIKTLQGNLGHATAAFTLDVYGHVSERMKDDSAARMQSYIDKAQKG